MTPSKPTIRKRHRVAGRRNAGRVPLSRSVVATAAIATVLILWVLGAAHCGLLRTAAPPAPRPVLTSHASPFAADFGQPHLDHRSAGLCHKALAIAVPPESSSTVLSALGVAVAPLAVTGFHAQRMVAAGRGPPRGLAAPLTGRDRLTRFCLARR